MNKLIYFAIFILFCSTMLCFSCGSDRGDSLHNPSNSYENDDVDEIIPDPTITELFVNSYKAFQLMRYSNGMYRDTKLFSENDFHPSSVACTGMGLISLCIAHKMDWENEAMDLALTTLKTLNGESPPFNPERSDNGFFRHFIDLETGECAWGSEFSTIDTAILMCGALFCKTYFNDPELNAQIDVLWKSIAFGDAIADVDGGYLYMTMDQQGNGTKISHIYNEYMILAWLAKNQSTSPNTPAGIFWTNHLKDPEKLTHNNYWGYELLSDSENSFLSSFTHQFNYYLCHDFTASDAYLDYFKRAQKADALWFKKAGAKTDYEWGLGAGESNTEDYYHADAIDNNEDMFVSPHVIAGFLPVYPDGKVDLISLYTNGKGVYALPGGDEILWRYSIVEPSWAAIGVQGIDYSTMLFGLASLPEYLGPNFFKTYNNYF